MGITGPSLHDTASHVLHKSGVWVRVASGRCFFFFATLVRFGEKQRASFKNTILTVKHGVGSVMLRVRG